MQRNETERRREPRRGVEREASARPLDERPLTDEDEDELHELETVPSYLTARELQAKEPAGGYKPEAENAAPAVDQRKNPGRRAKDTRY